MYVINQILFFLFLIIVFVLMGSFVLYSLKHRQSFSLSLIVGFSFINALFFVITMIARLFRWSFNTIYYVFVYLLILVLIFIVIYIIKKGVYRLYIELLNDIKEYINKKRAVYVFITLLLLAVLFFSCFCYWRSSDDSYYMPRAMEIVENNSIFLSESYSWLGYDLDAFFERTDISSYEIFNAVCAKLFNVPSTILCKNAMAIVFIILSYASLWQMFGAVFSNDDNKLSKQELSFIICIFLITLVGAYFNYGYSLPYWQIRNIWHGKTMLYTIIYPLIFKLCFDIYHTENNGYLKVNSLVLLSIVITSAVSTTIIGVIFPIILCFVIGVPFIVYCIVKNKLRAQSILQIVLAAIPTIICSMGTFIYISFNNDTYSSIYEVPNWLQIFKENMLISNGKFFILYILSSLYFVFKGNRIQKLILIGAPITLFITFLNPLLIGPVSQYITTSSVYWRLYLLLPIWYVPALAIGSIIVDYLPVIKNRLVVIGVFCLSTVLLIFVATKVEIRENPYSVPQDAIDIANFILNDYTGDDDPILYAFDDDKYTENLRQYTVEIDLLTGIRKEQREKNNIKAIMDITNQLSEDEPVYDYQILEVLNKCDVDYCCVEKKRIDLIPECEKITKVSETSNMIIYRVVK